MIKAFIRSFDEGHSCGALVNEYEGGTALMVNPHAETDTLIDAAMVRARRIVDLTKPFLEAENNDLSMCEEDFVRALISVGGMACEVHQILRAVLGVSVAGGADGKAP